MSIAYNSKPGLSWPITGAALQEPTGSLAARRRHVHVHVCACACLSACACNPNPNPNPYPNPNQVNNCRAGETGMVWVSEKSCAGYAIRGLGTRHGPHRGRWWYTGNRSKASADARTRWRGPGSLRPRSFLGLKLGWKEEGCARRKLSKPLRGAGSYEAARPWPRA